MKCVIQRVLSANVTVQDNIIAQINRGMVVFAGILNDDNHLNIKKMAQKICDLRIFSNSNGLFDCSVNDIFGDILVVSQFTLMADCSKGRRPNFTSAAPPDIAKPLIDAFVDEFTIMSKGKVASGEFGANMQVALVNDGPVTILLE